MGDGCDGFMSFIIPHPDRISLENDDPLTQAQSDSDLITYNLPGESLTERLWTLKTRVSSNPPTPS